MTQDIESSLEYINNSVDEIAFQLKRIADSLEKLERLGGNDYEENRKN